jgi:hypothetical protein
VGGGDVPHAQVGQTATEQSAYDRWMDQTAQRQQARIARVHGAEGIIPLPVWFALTQSPPFLVYMLFFADPGEGAITQSVLIGCATVIITVLILLLMFFDIRTARGWAPSNPPPCNDPSASSMPRST